MNLSLSSRIANGYGSNNGANVSATVTQGKQDIASNTTEINWSMSASYFCNAGWTWGGATRTNCGWFDLLIDGVTVGTIGLSVVNGWGNGTNIGTNSGKYKVTHNDKGKKSVSVQIRINPGTDPLNGGVYYQAATGGAQTLDLTDIPRVSDVSLDKSAIECNGSDSFAIYTNRKSTSFTHTLSWSFGTASGTIATGVGDSTSWTPSKNLLSQIPNAQSGWGRITCITYSGSTKIGESTVDFTLTVGSTSKPSLSGLTIAEQTSIVSQKAGSNATMALLSVKRVTLNASAKDGASVSSVIISNNGKAVTLSKSGSQYVGSISAVTSGKYTVTVTDSRGLSTSQEVSQTYYAYTYPTIVNASFTRTTATGSNGTLTASGKYANMLNNTVTIQVTRTGLSAVTIAGSKTGGSWNFSKSYSDLIYTNSYTATIKITDSFGQVAQLNVVLARSQPVLWIGKERVKLRNGYKYGKPVVESSGHAISMKWDGSEYISVSIDSVDDIVKIPVTWGGSLLQKVYPVGAIYISTVATSPSTLFGFGTWQRIEGRFLLGASSTYGAGSTGGEAAHTLTVNEMPQHNHWYAKLPDGAETYSWGWGNQHGTNVYAQTLVAAGTPGSNNLVTQQNSAHTTVNAGGGWSHNNMPPYLVVYIWKRTA